MVATLICVDDTVITSNFFELILTFISYRHYKFALKDIGAPFFLGVEVTCNASGIHLPQAKYSQYLLSKTRMIATASIATTFSIAFQLPV